MDPITAFLNLASAALQFQLEIFRALPDAEKTRRAVAVETWFFAVQQAAHDLFPKFPAPPAIAALPVPVKTS